MRKSHHGRKPREVVTQAGEVRLSRVYRRCVKCQLGGYALDERLGIEGRYSPHARRLISLAAASWSYDIASDRLEQFCGLSLSDTTARKVAQEEGAAMLEWQRTDAAAVQEFCSSAGDVEFTTDGTSVNTTDGWREAKIGIFSKRDRGESAAPSEWSERTLPSPNVSVAFAAIEASEQFGKRWKAWAKRLRLHDRSTITVLADGAKWIWEEARKNLVGAAGVLDIYHAIEAISDTSKKLFGEATPAATAWTDDLRAAVLERGWDGFEIAWQQTSSSYAADAPQHAILHALRNYLGKHVSHLDYAQRLHSGRSIGSGQVEGACKNLIGRRLKQTAARWRPQRLNRMAGLCSIMYSHQWNAYWTTQTH